MIVGIDHGYYAIKTNMCLFPVALSSMIMSVYDAECSAVSGKVLCLRYRETDAGKNKTSNDNYYLLTLAAIAEEIKNRKAERKTEVILAVGLPLSSFGREKQGFREYLLRKEQPVRFLYESEWYEIQIKDVKLFPQGTLP